jgi:hypothetical protein
MAIRSPSILKDRPKVDPYLKAISRQPLREAWPKRRYEAHFISKLTDCDGENSETDTSLDFAKDCGYIDLATHQPIHLPTPQQSHQAKPFTRRPPTFHFSFSTFRPSSIYQPAMRLLLLCLLTAIGSYLVGTGIMIKANPECDFWNNLEQLRDRSLMQLRESHPTTPTILFAGGSSCAFSIDPQTVSQVTGIPSINLGGPAHAGTAYLIPRVMDSARSGDIVVLALEPHFLTNKATQFPTPLGLALLVRQGKLSQAFPHAHRLRPGAIFLATWIAKCATNKLLYRYDSSHLRPGGRIEHTSSFDPPPSSTKPAFQLSKQGQQFLQNLSRQASQRQIKLFYSLPWQFTHTQDAPSIQETNRKLLASIGTFIDCLDDPALGVSTSKLDFSDTPNHLSFQGSKSRSKSVASSLRQKFAPIHSQ